MSPRSDFDSAKGEKFLAGIRLSGVVKRACQLSGISRDTAYRWRKNRATFLKAWDVAMDERLDNLEEKVLITDDLPTIRWVLARRRPDVWGDKVAVEHSGKIEVGAGAALEQKLILIAEALDYDPDPGLNGDDEEDQPEGEPG